MVDIKGVLLKLKSENEHKVDKDDHFYVGVCGKGKAREFPLDVYGHDGFNAGADVKCRFGDVLEGDLRTDVKEPCKVSSSNYPKGRHIDMNKVSRVYLRKQSHNGGDNVWKLNEAEVTLYGPNFFLKRIFYKSEEFGSALEYGLKVWLREH